MDLGPVLSANLVFVGLAVGALWATSVAIRDASIVDVFWGPGFAGIAAITLSVAGVEVARQVLVALLAALWGLRLGAYLLWRNWGGGEDPRYARMRRQHGARFWWVSALTVFALQGTLMLIVSLPVQVAGAAHGPAGLGLPDGLGVLLWGVGVLFETVGDLQLARFRADPANAGRVLDTGLWRYTRHPNYFGDFCVWWGIFVVALGAPGGAWTAIGPALMTFLLLRVSGVPMLERGMARRRPDYAAYVERTSAFFPRPPRPRGTSGGRHRAG